MTHIEPWQMLLEWVLVALALAIGFGVTARRCAQEDAEREQDEQY